MKPPKLLGKFMVPEDGDNDDGLYTKELRRVLHRAVVIDDRDDGRCIVIERCEYDRMGGERWSQVDYVRPGPQYELILYLHGAWPTE